MSAAAGCPAWCDRNPRLHPDTEGRNAHQRVVGSLGVSVGADDGGPATVFVPTTEDAVGDVVYTPAQARQLGADLTAAVELIEGDASA